RHLYCAQGTVDVADEGGRSLTIRQSRSHRQHRTCGEADHADTVGVDLPFGRPAANQVEGSSCINHLRREEIRGLIRRWARRPGWRRPGGLRGTCELLQIPRRLVK